ncbi:group-specific protein [Bacillus thuringiensis MC28]|nr:group-specific protein [Bacillus thuringiensis MC28]
MKRKEGVPAHPFFYADMMKEVVLMELTLNSTVCLHTIQFRKEQKNYIVKDTITGEEYEMPPLWIDALAMMRDGFLLGEIEEKLKEEYPAEEVNILAFTRQLLELELVGMVDGEEIACTKKKEKDYLAWVRPRLEQFFLNVNKKYRSKGQ